MIRNYLPIAHQSTVPFQVAAMSATTILQWVVVMPLTETNLLLGVAVCIVKKTAGADENWNGKVTAFVFISPSLISK